MRLPQQTTERSAAPEEPRRASSTWPRFFSRQLRWGPTWRGWLLLIACASIVGVTLLRSIHPFLALNQPLNADVLVIEGWIPEHALVRCADLIKKGSFKAVVTVGGPVTGMASPANDDDTHAWVAMRRLQKLGVDRSAIQIVPSNRAARDRTFRFAIDVRTWLQRERIDARTINVVTLGPHARRSRLLFQHVFRDSAEVGVIAMPVEEYDPKRWWRYSEGIREVIAETAAYLYARFLFSPEDAEENDGRNGRIPQTVFAGR